jgi:ferritin-like metal-binding protein YciE
MKTAKKTAARPAAKKASSGKTKPKSDAASGLKELFEDGLKDLYWAEKALVKALPKLVKNSSNASLKAAIEEHIAVTERQVTRLEEVFESIDKKPSAKKCDAMQGLIEEAETVIQETEPGVVRDAGIIYAAQKVEHYEIASYGTLRAFAEALGLEEAESLLKETLDEEKEADVQLTELAVSAINEDAVMAGEDEEEEEE